MGALDASPNHQKGLFDFSFWLPGLIALLAPVDEQETVHCGERLKDRCESQQLE
jgi:hypothetical protein